MEKINLPNIIEEKISDSQSKFVVEPLFPGYGTTIGNSLRRVLLSSITGAAVTSFKIEGISHEFSAVPGVKEDVIEVMMNLKSINFRSFSEEPVVLILAKKGAGEIKAADIKANSNIEILNPEQHIATLDQKADLAMEITVEIGRGFRPVGNHEERNEIGIIATDALFSPVERVSVSVEDTRVGQMTNYDKLTLEIVTNGTITPYDALKEASSVLVDHYGAIITGNVTEKEVSAEDAKMIESEPESEQSDGVVDSKTKTENLGLSPRTTNALVNAGIKTLGGLKRLSDLKIEEIKGLGKKGVDEIKEFLG